MSSSSQPSRSQRTPLHERSNSQKNTLAIRVVPYSPPRLEAEAGSYHSGETSADNEGAHQTANEPRRPSLPGTKDSFAFIAREGYSSSHGSALSSPTSSTISLATAKEHGVSGAKLTSDSSGGAQGTSPNPVYKRPSYSRSAGSVTRSRQPFEQDDDPTSPQPRRPLSRRQNVIEVHADKTFSLALRPTKRGAYNDSSFHSSLKSPQLSAASTYSSHERPSFDAPSEDHPSRPSSPPTSLAERSVSPYTPFTPGSSAAPTEIVEDHIGSSPGNYRMVGGLRKVAKTPDLKQKGKEREVVTPTPLPSLPEGTPEPQPQSPLHSKPSFGSEQTDSTISERTNYKILGRSSPPLPDTESINLPSSSDSNSNYQILGESSPAPSIVPSFNQGIADTPGSQNYVVHNDPFLDTPGSKNFVLHDNSSPTTSVLALTRKPRLQPSDESLLLKEKHSQDSLVLPTTLPRKKSSIEKFGYFRQKSRESLRSRAGSFTSISSVISQDAASAFFTTPNLVRLASVNSFSVSPSPSTWAGPSKLVPHKNRMEAHPHVWSSQLSTVPSESEGGSVRDSRSLSGFSIPARGSSAWGSRHSRQMLSISSSQALEESQLEGSYRSRSNSRSHSRSNSLDRPSPAFIRDRRELPSPPIRTVRDIDEHGDGLADLGVHHDLRERPSRSRLSLLSRKSSDRNLHSSASSRSFTSASIPAWARVYYGSGERRWLGPPSIMTVSESGDSRPVSSFESGSPTGDTFPPNIFNPRRRAREVQPHDGRPGSMEIAQVQPYDQIRLRPRKMTSSIWSPHLGMDRRATRYSIWEMPSATWSADKGGIFGRRNIQVILFMVGFVFPFAWMIAAFLPLPPKSQLDMVERDHSTTQFGIPEEPEPYFREPTTVNDRHYLSARWWRMLNRVMAVIGLLVLGAVAALIVIGLRQKWVQR